MADPDAAAFGWAELLTALVAGRDLSTEEATAVFEEILGGRATPAQLGAFLIGLRAKGERAEEIAGFVTAMRRHGERVEIAVEAIDTCGTGGDRSGTINVSTAAALVAAGAGVPVCKHGNRAASSLAGSADVLEALGVAIDLGPAEVARCVVEAGIGFCFAPRFHPAMRHAGPVRRELGLQTVFNLLGPLANPAGVGRQVIGVCDRASAETMLGALEAAGARHVIVCYGHDGLDELSTVTTSTVHESLIDGNGRRERRTYEVDPRALGLAPATREALLGGDAEENARRLRRILDGERGPQRDIVLLNAAAALIVAGRADDLAEGLVLAERVLDSGAARDALERFVASSVALAATATA